MPSRPKKPCNAPNCPNLVEATERYCTKHKRQASKLRGSAHKQGYGSNWRKVRRMILNQEPLCRRCKAKGITVLAFMVHHIDGNNKNNVRENLEPLCDSCHRAEHGFGGSRGRGADGGGSGVQADSDHGVEPRE